MTPELTAYRAQLRRVAWPLRLSGLVMILAGGALLAFAGPASPGLRTPGFALLGCGWALWFYVIHIRTRWAREHPFTGAR